MDSLINLGAINGFCSKYMCNSDIRKRNLYVKVQRKFSWVRIPTHIVRSFVVDAFHPTGLVDPRFCEAALLAACI